MAYFQRRNRIAWKVLRNATLALAFVSIMAACSDTGQQAASDAALAQQYLESGNIAAARQAINAALIARDDVVDFQLLKGRIELASASTSSAYTAYHDALSLDPTNAEALQAVSQLGLSTGHLQDSLEATDRILTLAPEQPDALLTRGVHAMIRGRYEEAVKYADKVLTALPGNENASILKARALFLNGDQEPALAALSAWDGSTDPSVVALTKLEIFRELRRPEDMKRQFGRLAQLRSLTPALQLDEANLRFKLGERAAADQLVAAVLAGPKLGDADAASAVALWAEYGTNDLSSAQLKSIARTGSVASREALAHFLLDSNSLVQAHDLIDSLEGVNRDSLIARAHAREGKYAPALALAAQVLKQDATQCDALIAQSQSSLGLNKAEDALRYGQVAAAECPEDTASWLAAASAYAALNRPTGVERIFKQAFDAHPQDLRVVRGYAEWLLQNKRNREAVAIARRLTVNAPALLSGWTYYDGICRRARGGCESDAARGLENARTIFGVDLAPGSQARNGLMGRFVRR